MYNQEFIIKPQNAKQTQICKTKLLPSEVKVQV
jgi:hypothetical protein